MKSKYIVFSAMGVELVGLILASIWLGQILDQKWSLKGGATAGLMVLSLIGWFIQIIFLLQRMNKDEN